MLGRSRGNVCLYCWGAWGRVRQQRGGAGSSFLFLGNLIRAWAWNSPSDLNNAFGFLKGTPTGAKARVGSIAPCREFCSPARASSSAGILIPMIKALIGRGERGGSRNRGVLQGSEPQPGCPAPAPAARGHCACFPFVVGVLTALPAHPPCGGVLGELPHHQVKDWLCCLLLYF